MSSIGYKLFRTSKKYPGELFPLYVLADKPISVGVWLNAESGPQDETEHVRSRLGPLAYRPGWHINDECPYVAHIYSVHNGRRYQKDGTIWAEVEYSDAIDYQPEADEAGRNKKGKIIRKNACLRHVPENGCYRYKTSPSMYGEWIIAGQMKITRILTNEEVKKICRAHGLEPLEVWNHGKER